MIGFYANGKLQKVNISGGSPEVIFASAQIPWRITASWGNSGVILYHMADVPGVLYQVSAQGGEPKPATRLDTSATACWLLKDSIGNQGG
jgi:hypothetical protein